MSKFTWLESNALFELIERALKQELELEPELICKSLARSSRSQHHRKVYLQRLERNPNAPIT